MRGKTRTRSGIKKKKRRRRNNGNVNEIVRENEHRFYAKRQNPTRSTFQFSPSRAEPSRAVQTLMLKFTSPINPSFRSMHLDSVYLLDQERCCPFRYFDNECVVKPVFRFYPCRANFFRDKKDAANISEHVRGGKS